MVAPDADNNRFPLNLQYNGKSWSIWWDYTDRNSAKDFYLTRTHLKAEGLFQIEETAQLRPKLTAARVTHLATKETREFDLATPSIFNEIVLFEKFQQEEATATWQVAKFQQEKATDMAAREKEARLLARKVIGNDRRFIAYDDGTVLDTRTNLMWASKDNDPGLFNQTTWDKAKNYCENYRGGGYTDWRMPTLDELKGLYDPLIKGYRRHLTDLITITEFSIWASDMLGSDAATFNFFRGKEAWLPNKRYPHNLGALPVRPGK
jgi:hypothetical protein